MVLDTTVNHMPELLEFDFEPDVAGHDDHGAWPYILAGCTCLAGDVFGEYDFSHSVEVGDRVVFLNAGSYSLVKAHTFNGVNLPSIYSLDKLGKTRLVSSSPMKTTPPGGRPMSAVLYEREVAVPVVNQAVSPLNLVERGIREALAPDEVPIRMAVTSSSAREYRCEIGLASRLTSSAFPSIFQFARRPIENTTAFNCVLLVPTGVGAEIGGHAGDATPVAALLAAACDTLITPPQRGECLRHYRHPGQRALRGGQRHRPPADGHNRPATVPQQPHDRGVGPP